MTDTKDQNKKIWRWIKIGLGIILAAALIGGVIWATYTRPPLPDSLAALESDELVDVSLEPWIIFDPAGDETVGLIYYPGGRVDPRGYSPLLREISEQGYMVVVPSMPINMAIFNTDAADEIIAYFPVVENWVIAGHSVGGAAAAIYANNNPEDIAGLVIWASFPPNNSELASTNLPVTLIYGELDEGSNLPVLEDRKSLLPQDTVYVEIPGGDHHQFGSYLVQEDKDRSTISKAEQHKIIVDATLDLLKQVSE